MVRKQLSIHRPHQNQGLLGELALLSDEMRAALFAALDAYEALGIRFALVGGLAVGSYAEPRATKDIDFLVGDEAFTRRGAIIAFAQPMPLQAFQVPIDPIPLPEAEARHGRLQAGLLNPVIDRTTGRAIAILPANELAYMKLASARPKDRGDIVALVLAGKAELEVLESWTQEDAELSAALAKVRTELEAEE